MTMYDEFGEHNTMTAWDQEKAWGKVEGRVCWTDRKLEKILRFRLLSDPGCPNWEVSYCIGKLKDGMVVYVELPFSTLPKRNWKLALIQEARADQVYAKGLGFLDPTVYSLLN